MMSVTKEARKSTDDQTFAELHGKLKNKGYASELARLHVELVKVQEWVVHKGLKVRDPRALCDVPGDP